MILKANDKEVEIKLKLRDIVKLTDTNKKNNLQEFFMESIQNANIKNLATMIQTFGYIENEKAFKTETEVYDFLDKYIEESGSSMEDLFVALGEEINNSGFFIKKMSKEELKATMLADINLDIQAIVSDIVKEVATDKVKPVVEEQFKGFKA